MLKAFARFTAQLLWPMRCAACDHLIPDDASFCAACAVSLVPIAAPCAGCALPLATTGVRCAPCRAQPFPFSGADAPLAYGGALTSAILRFKHAGRRDLARPLARYLAASVAEAVEGGVDVILPVPLHPRRLRRRGYNQSLSLARAAAPRGTVVLPDTLRRVRDTEILGHASPGARRALLAGAFTVHREAEVRSRRCLVIDDVLTTGATLAGCAAALLEAGAADVRVAALARTP